MKNPLNEIILNVLKSRVHKGVSYYNSIPEHELEEVTNSIILKLNIFNGITNNSGKSIVEDTFNEIDEKFGKVLNIDTIEWIKIKLLSHITEAYNRGKEEK